MQFYLRLYLPDDILVKVDRASMAFGLEARAPFLDIDLVNFVRRIPSEYKLRGRTTKYLLKEAARSLLPKEIVDRRKKGFGWPDRPLFSERPPQSQWLVIRVRKPRRERFRLRKLWGDRHEPGFRQT